MSKRGEEQLEVYSAAMQFELLDNAHKGPWLDEEDLEVELVYHVAKLLAAVKEKDQEAILEYAADVGNCSWFIADAHEALKQEFFHEGPIEYDGHLMGVNFTELKKQSKEFVEKILALEELPF